MIKENQLLFNRLNVLLDGLIVIVSMLLAKYIRFYIFSGLDSIGFSSYAWLGVTAAFIYAITYTLYGLYESHRFVNFHKEAGRLIWANLINTIILLALLYVFHLDNFSRWVLVIFFCASSILLLTKRAFTRILLRYIRKKGLNHKHIVLVGQGSSAQTYLKKIHSNPEFGFIVDGHVSNQDTIPSLPWLGFYNELESVLNDPKPDEVVIAIPAEDESFLPYLINTCEKTGIRLSLISPYAEFISSKPSVVMLDGLAMVNPRHVPLDNIGNAVIKRLSDLIASVLLTILLLPLMVIVSIGVKLSSPGPIIFKQERLGKNSKPFYIYKFRSMYLDNPARPNLEMKKNDKKTRFGAWIRKYSIDELPQLFNVIKGEMSLVGPRPEIPYYVKKFQEQIPRYMIKHQVLPGMTGWAQVNGLRGDTPIPKRIEYDLFYIENWNILFDLKILCLTPFNLLAK